MEVITKSAQQTQKLGEKIGRDLRGRDIVALYGELGSGKTTFIQGVAKGLGIKKRIVSPTFVLVRQYQATSHQSPITFYHIDLYRIEKFNQARSLGLGEVFADKNGIVAIEWAEKIKKILPKKRVDIQFNYLNYNERRIIINEMK